MYKLAFAFLQIILRHKKFSWLCLVLILRPGNSESNTQVFYFSCGK